MTFRGTLAAMVLGLGVLGGCALIAKLGDYQDAGDAGDARGGDDGGSGDDAADDAGDDAAPTVCGPADAGADSGCPPLRATCDSHGLACGTELDTNPQNCGACGHACEGKCDAGLCEPVTVIDADTASRNNTIIAGVMDGFAYLVSHEVSFGDLGLYSAPTDLDAGLPKPTRLGALDPMAARSMNVTSVAVDTSGIYVGMYGVVFEAPLDAGRTPLLIPGVNTGGADTQRFAFDARFAYFTDLRAVERAPKLGDASTPLVAENGATGLTLSNSRAYFVNSVQGDASSGELRWVVPANGGSHLYAAIDNPRYVASDGVYLFWNDGASVYRSTVGDTIDARVALYVSTDPTPGLTLAWLEQRGEFVYFMTNAPLAGQGVIYRVRKCGGDVVALTPTISTFGGEAFDRDFIYFASSEAILRIPR